MTVRLCCFCGKSIANRHILAERCMACAVEREGHLLRRPDDPRRQVQDMRSKDHAFLMARRKAMSVVGMAVKRGDIKKAKEYKCVDCGRGGQVYDHRDYDKPLAIEPVCRSCNILRGSAKWTTPKERTVMKTKTAIRLAGSAVALTDILGLTPQASACWKRDLPHRRVEQLKEKRPEWFK